MYGTSICVIMDTLLIAGSMADKSDSGKKDPPYPGESPTAPEQEHWRKGFENNLRGTDYEALLSASVTLFNMSRLLTRHGPGSLTRVMPLASYSLQL